MISVEKLQRLGLERTEARQLAASVNSVLETAEPVDAWRQITAASLSPNMPFEVHCAVRNAVFAESKVPRGPAPLWSPGPRTFERTNIAALMQRAGVGDYAALHRWSVENREAYWQAAIETLGIRYRHSPSQILSLANGPRAPRWLVDAKLNIVESCFTAELAAPAIAWGSPGRAIEIITYRELRDLANRISNGLARAGFASGDPIAMNMPMTVEAVAIYLGIIQAGMVVVSIADSCAAPEISTRLRIAGAKAIFCVDHFVRSGKRVALYEKLMAAGGPQAIVLPGPQNNSDRRRGDIGWQSFLSDHQEFEPRPSAPDDPINVLFSSGTTGDPKAIPWCQATPIQCAADGYYHHDLHPGNVVAWPTNLGWMMGPWLVFATLINKGTIGLFDGAPLDRPFGQFVQDAKVNMLGVVPSLVRRWRQTKCMKGLDWSCIRAFSSTGECSNPDDMFYLMHLAGYRPVIEYCGGTEIGGGYMTSTFVQPNAPSTFSTPALGIDVVILDPDGRPASNGELFLVPPAIGLSTRLINQDHDEVYYQNVPLGPAGQLLRRHGDQFEVWSTPFGRSYRALGRADDTMNLGGIKVSSAEIERAIQNIDRVKETAAIAVAAPDGGPARLVIYAVCSDGVRSGEDLLVDMQAAIRSRLNPLFKVCDVVIVDALPRTASQKVMRRKLRVRYQGSG